MRERDPVGRQRRLCGISTGRLVGALDRCLRHRTPRRSASCWIRTPSMASRTISRCWGLPPRNRTSAASSSSCDLVTGVPLTTSATGSVAVDVADEPVEVLELDDESLHAVAIVATSTSTTARARRMLIRSGLRPRLRREQRRAGRGSGTRSCGPRRPVLCSSGGYSCLQMSCAFQQRGWKWQPDGGLAGLGTSPSSTIRWRWRSCRGSGIGTAESSAWV